MTERLQVDDIALDLDAIPDRFERLEYLIDLGRELATLTDDKKTEQNRVLGCMSNVWLDIGWDGDVPPRLVLRADSDAQIVRGLLAILLAACDGKTAAEIGELDVDAVFGRLSLAEHLTPGRQNGLRAAFEKVKAVARVCSMG